MSQTNNYDFIVVGGGSAGCVLAHRLSERPDISVLLLEAGPRDRSLLLSMPLAFRILRQRMLFDWGYASEPEPCAGGRSIPAPRGRVLGGSSAINGMMYSRGQPADYDGWVQAGATGWSYEEVLPYFKRGERSWRGPSRWHGDSGPLATSPMSASDPLIQAMFETARRQGHGVTQDFEGEQPEGFGLPDLTTTATGRRASASQAFLGAARGRPNLRVITGAAVSRVVVQGGRAVGVAYQLGGSAHVAHAGREVVLCAGAYASPHLLMLSGIGPADHLRATGVDVQLDLPGVGENLQEHPLVPMGFKASRPFVFGASLRADRLAWSVLRWLLTGAGMAGTQPLTSIAYYRSSPAVGSADLENIFMPTSLNAHVWMPGLRRPYPDMLTSLNVALRPRSRGTVRLRSARADDAPKIQFNLLAEPHDVQLLRHALRWTRELVRQQPLAEHIGDEAFPGAALQDDAQLDAYIRQTAQTAQHPAGTCRMGQDSDAVVDPSLRVRGIQGLRVADASVMPTLVSGHTNAVCMMIGERAAQMMLDDSTAAGIAATRRGG